MGPIDFTKFDAVRKKYLSFFKIDKMSVQLADLKIGFPEYADYLDFINTEKKLKKIIVADNNTLLTIKNSLDNCSVKFQYGPCQCETCDDCLADLKKRKFHNSVMEILDYAYKGKNSLRKVYSKIGIKTCYICNAQYALAIEPETSTDASSKQKRYAAKFQFDHYLPKNEYPALSISLYNLFPICSSCNQIKGDREIGIDFFSSDFSRWKDKFKFSILEGSLSEFLIRQKRLQIDFTDHYKYPEGMSCLSDRYDIKGIYNTQIDLVEELIIRKLKYSDTYKDKLSGSFPELFKNINIEDRIQLGTYTKVEDIHKRPMTKFLQDIDKQLEEYFQLETSKLKKT